MSGTADIDRIRAEQIRTIYRNTPPGLFIALVAISVMTCAFVYIEPSLRDGAVIFILVMIAQTVARLLLQRTFARVQMPDADWRRWATWFCSGTVVGGTTIGAGTMMLLPAGNTELELIALPVIFAITSGAVGAFA